MILLGMDTCGSVTTVALARVVADSAAGHELEVLGSAELPGLSTAAMLVPALGKMLLEAGVPLGQIEGLVVVDGPGSFTGIRIGLSTVKALSEARSLPVFAVSRLQVLAAAQGALSAALDAGRNEFFFGCHKADSEESDRRLQGSPAGNRLPSEAYCEWLLTQDELHSRLVEDFAGHADLVVCEPKAAAAFPLARLTAAPHATDALRFALPLVFAGQQADVAGLDGRYLRRSDLYRLTQPGA